MYLNGEHVLKDYSLLNFDENNLLFVLFSDIMDKLKELTESSDSNKSDEETVKAPVTKKSKGKNSNDDDNVCKSLKIRHLIFLFI